MTDNVVDHAETHSSTQDGTGFRHRVWRNKIHEPKKDEIELLRGNDDDEENEDGTENSMRIENKIHSRIEALKNKVNREMANNDIKRSEDRQVKWKQPPRANTYEDDEEKRN
jgi:hypothetical protein